MGIFDEKPAWEKHKNVHDVGMSDQTPFWERSNNNNRQKETPTGGLFMDGLLLDYFEKEAIWLVKIAIICILVVLSMTAINLIFTIPMFINIVVLVSVVATMSMSYLVYRLKIKYIEKNTKDDYDRQLKNDRLKKLNNRKNK